MANTPQSRKRARQNKIRRLRNHSQASAMRTSVKRALQTSDPAAAGDATRKAISLIDRAARKGLHHKHKAAHLKSQLSKRLRSLSTPPAS